MLLPDSYTVDYLDFHPENWESVFNGRSIGLEKEFNVLDADGTLPEFMRVQELIEEVESYIELSDYPQSRFYWDHGSLCTNALEIATQVADDVLTAGENLSFVMNLANYSLRSGQYIQLGGMLDDVYQGLHINLGADDILEAVAVANALRQHLPEFVALSSNSDRCRSYLNSEFPEKFDTGYEFAQSTCALPHDTTPSPIYFKNSRIELRVCDSQESIEQDLMLVSYAWAIQQKAIDAHRSNNQYPISRPENLLIEMYKSARQLRLDASADNIALRRWISESREFLDQ